MAAYAEYSAKFVKLSFAIRGTDECIRNDKKHYVAGKLGPRGMSVQDEFAGIVLC